MKSIQEIFDDFYNKHLIDVDEKGLLKNNIDKGNYQFVLGYAQANNIPSTKEVEGADLFLKFKLLRSRQIGSAGERLFKSDYELVAGDNSLQKIERGDQDQLNPDFLELKKKKYIEVKTATIYKGNKFIFEQIRLNDPRINYYVFLGVTPEGRFYWILNKKSVGPGKVVFGAKFSPQHSTTGSNATYQWHPSFEQMESYIIQPERLSSSIT